jgi:hypothetical protein
MNGFVRVIFVSMFLIEGTTYIYWPMDDFVRVEVVILY